MLVGIALYVPVWIVQSTKIWFKCLQQVRVIWLEKHYSKDSCGDVGHQGIRRIELSLAFLILVHIVFRLVVEAREVLQLLNSLAWQRTVLCKIVDALA